MSRNLLGAGGGVLPGRRGQHVRGAAAPRSAGGEGGPAARGAAHEARGPKQSGGPQMPSSVPQNHGRALPRSHPAQPFADRGDWRQQTRQDRVSELPLRTGIAIPFPFPALLGPLEGAWARPKARREGARAEGPLSKLSAGPSGHKSHTHQRHAQVERERADDGFERWH